MSFFSRWSNWVYGDVLYGPDLSNIPNTQYQILQKLVVGFKSIHIDWHLGDAWVAARIAKNIEFGLSGTLLEAEYSLVNHAVLVAISDSDSKDDSTRIEFVMTNNTEAIDLYYPAEADIEECRKLASKLARILEYELVIAEG